MAAKYGSLLMSARWRECNAKEALLEKGSARFYMGLALEGMKEKDVLAQEERLMQVGRVCTLAGCLRRRGGLRRRGLWHKPYARWQSMHAGRAAGADTYYNFNNTIVLVLQLQHTPQLQY